MANTTAYCMTEHDSSDDISLGTLASYEEDILMLAESDRTYPLDSADTISDKERSSNRCAYDVANTIKI